jgi:hypothetical protein
MKWEVQVSVRMRGKRWAERSSELREQFSLYGDSGSGLGFDDISRQHLSKNHAVALVAKIAEWCKLNRLVANAPRGSVFVDCHPY